MEEILEYLFSEQDIVEELIKIDNDIMNTKYEFNTYYDGFKTIIERDVNKIVIDKDTVFVTEGDVLTTLELLNRIECLNNVVIFINQGYVGMNKWLVSKYVEVTGNNKVILDTSINYNKYIDNGYRVVPIGEDSLIDQVMEDFYG